MRRFLPLASMAFCVCSALPARATPDLSKRVPLSFTGIDIVKDNAQDDVYYIIPNELVVDSNRFSSRSSYAWRVLADGTASVQMIVRLYGSDDLIMQATREINQDTGKSVRYRGLEVKNARVTLSEDPALISSVDLTLSTNADPASREGSSFSKVILRFRLTRDGVANWKAAIRQGQFLVAGKLSFDFKVIDDAGRERIMPLEVPLTVRNLADPDEMLDTTRAITSLATQRGEQYFYGQYTACRMFFDNVAFRAPVSGELESDDPAQSDAERALYVNTATNTFQNAVERQRMLCTNEVERLRGEHWMNTILEDRGFATCHNADALPPWSEFFLVVHVNTPSFIAGAQTKYGDYESFCSTPLEVADSRVNMNGDCVKNMAIAFSEGLDAGTIAGNVVVYSTDFPTNRYAKIAVEKLEDKVLVFHFETPLCRNTRDYIVELTESLRGTSGRHLSPVYAMPLDFAPRGLLHVTMTRSPTPEHMCIKPGDVPLEPPEQVCSVNALCTAKQGGISFTRDFDVPGSLTRATLSASGTCIDTGTWLVTLPATAVFQGCEAEVRCH